MGYCSESPSSPSPSPPKEERGRDGLCLWGFRRLIGYCERSTRARQFRCGTVGLLRYARNDATQCLFPGRRLLLTAASLPVVVVNLRQVRNFVKATGQLAKTDAVDAAILAQFTEAVRPALRPMPDGTNTASGQPCFTPLDAWRSALEPSERGRWGFP
jgi:hypothetical protein